MMEKKRFQIDDDGDITEFENQQWIDTFEYANGKDWDNLCKRLNELFDENEQLKQLKQRCYEKIYDYNTLKCEFDNLQKENERLKQEVNSLMEDLGYINAELEKLEDIDRNVIR